MLNNLAENKIKIVAIVTGHSIVFIWYKILITQKYGSYFLSILKKLKNRNLNKFIFKRKK